MKAALKKLSRAGTSPSRIYRALKRFPCSVCGRPLARGGQVLGHPAVAGGACLPCQTAAAEVEAALARDPLQPLLDAIDRYDRQKAKAANFGLMYGRSVTGRALSRKR